MGGRIAEEIIFGQMTTGAGNDIERATELARSMVCEWGMSEKLGPLAFGKKEGEVFLGREFRSGTSDYSEADRASRSTPRCGASSPSSTRARRRCCIENKPALDRIAEALLEYETLDGVDVDVLIRGETLVKSKPLPMPQKPPEVRRPEVKEKSKILDALGGLTAPVPKTEVGKA